MKKLLLSGIIFVPVLLQAQPKKLSSFLTVIGGIEGLSYFQDIGDISLPFAFKKNVPVSTTALELTLGSPKVYFYGQVNFSGYYYDNNGFNRSAGTYEKFLNTKADTRIFRAGFLLGLGGNIFDNRVNGRGVSWSVNAGLGAKFNITQNTSFTQELPLQLSLLNRSYGNSQTDLEVNSRLKYNFHYYFGFVLGTHLGLSFAQYKPISKLDSKVNPILRYGISLGLIF